MLNEETVYWQTGFAAGVARRKGDEHTAASHARHYRAMRAAELAKDRAAAESAYKRGYAEGGRP